MSSNGSFSVWNLVVYIKQRPLVFLAAGAVIVYGLLFFRSWMRAKDSWGHTMAAGFGALLIASVVLLAFRIRARGD